MGAIDQALAAAASGAAVDLRGATFEFRHSDVLGALLTRPGTVFLDACVLREVELSSADLQAVRARRVRLYDCHFQQCRLREWDMAYAYVADTSFDLCRMEASTVVGATFWGGRIWKSEFDDVRMRNTSLVRGPAGVPELPDGQAYKLFQLTGSRLRNVDLTLSLWVGVSISSVEVEQFDNVTMLGLEWQDLFDADGRGEASLARRIRAQHEAAGWPRREKPMCYLHPRRELCTVDLVPSRMKVFVSFRYDKPELMELYHEAIGPALDASDFIRDRMLDRPRGGSITCGECQHLQEAACVIAEISDPSPTVALEIGMAFGRSVPVILIAERGKPVPASFASLRRLEYSSPEELYNVLCDELQAMPRPRQLPGSALAGPDLVGNGSSQ